MFKLLSKYTTNDDKTKVIDELEKNLIDGIECEHRKHSPEEIMWIEKYCDIHGLLKSGGSDRHTKNHLIGYACSNQRKVDISLVNDWINDIQPVYSRNSSNVKITK